MPIDTFLWGQNIRNRCGSILVEIWKLSSHLLGRDAPCLDKKYYKRALAMEMHHALHRQLWEYLYSRGSFNHAFSLLMYPLSGQSREGMRPSRYGSHPKWDSAEEKRGATVLSRLQRGVGPAAQRWSVSIQTHMEEERKERSRGGCT